VVLVVAEEAMMTLCHFQPLINVRGWHSVGISGGKKKKPDRLRQ
jgi:hypothetical protein